jgi:hypothetical protein
VVKVPFPALTACVALLSLSSAGCSDNTDTGGPEVQWPPVQFRFPLVETELFAPPIGVDHDPAVHDGVEKALCTNYNGDPFPGCYDEHDGSDYLLDGDWDQMDAGSATIVAAADGVVVHLDDGHYDRCHGDVSTFESSCDGNSGQANYVILEHDTPYGPIQTLYWHMMTDTVAVAVGDTVACGDTLGRVGSSGNSSQPHLHFEVNQGDYRVDPYAGLYSQSDSWWTDQGESWELPSTACAQ